MKTIQVFTVRRDSCIRKKPRNKKKALIPIEKQEPSSLARKENVISPRALANKLSNKKEKVLGTKKTRQPSSSRFKSPGIKRQVESCDILEQGVKILETSHTERKTRRDILIDACSVLLEGKGETTLSTQSIQKELGRFGDIEQIVLSEDEKYALVRYSIDDAAVNCNGMLNLPEEANACSFTVRMAQPEDNSLLNSVADNHNHASSTDMGHCKEDNVSSLSCTDFPINSRRLIVYEEF
ncbi:hypothetical protein GpartN1_g5043.t1 [Galdieria partita]|uniref:RRM domain-containing protein n=1 Tax=Galdieria partita TaxID=83374 RepID=A0A9C7US61_9RHOD|nr:hypothetical protein GpartN1_g5043.t1 [Galdieria partita]